MLPARRCSYLSGRDGGPLRVLGLGHGWFGISAADATGVQELFFIAWACLFLFLVIPCLKLPLVYPLAVALVFVAVALAAIGDAVADYEDKGFPDYQAEPGEKAFVFSRCVPFESSASSS